MFFIQKLFFLLLAIGLLLWLRNSSPTWNMKIGIIFMTANNSFTKSRKQQQRYNNRLKNKNSKHSKSQTKNNFFFFEHIVIVHFNLFMKINIFYLRESKHITNSVSCLFVKYNFACECDTKFMSEIVWFDIGEKPIIVFIFIVIFFTLDFISLNKSKCWTKSSYAIINRLLTIFNNI